MPTTSRAFAAADDAPEDAEQLKGLQTAFGDVAVERMGPRDLLTDMLYGLARRAGETLAPVLFGTPLYRLTLSGASPDHQPLPVIDPVRGQIATANALFTGIWQFEGQTLKTVGRAPWRLEPPSERWAEALHSFKWLRHYRAAQGDTANAQARALLSNWLSRYDHWHAIAWRPHVTGRRIAALLASTGLLFDGADNLWRDKVLRSIAEQAHHLSRTLEDTPHGAPRFSAAVGLALAGLSLSEPQRFNRGLQFVARELSVQISADGGHASRNPAVLVEIFAELLMLRLSLDHAREPVPEFLSRALTRMAAALRLLRHGDGRLALFNGANEEPHPPLDMLLDRAGEANAGAQPHSSGYYRLSANKALLIFDAGTAPRGRFAAQIHGAPLAFEFSAGTHRLIVNCGAAETRGAEWRRAARMTSAHSTLCLGDFPALRSVTNKWLRSLIGERPLRAARRVECARENAPEGSWLWAAHDGYAHCGFVHERRVYLDAEGNDLRGEDRLLGAARHGAPSKSSLFTIRFHLHPDVRASLARDGQTVLLLLPNGDGWRFRAAGGHVALEESIYLGRVAQARKSEQITITGQADAGLSPAANVKWALRRLTTKSVHGAA